ncbi:MAG TPA: hypothetical protein GXZ42_00225 [Clostridiales bacterium]|nr:hypothetical protein [Clostridiales bacterium]
MLREKHEFFKMIKKRLVENNYSQVTVKIKNQRLSEVYFLNNKKMTRDEIRDITLKISEMMQSDRFISDPLSKLILNYEEFKGLDEIAKQRYILDLSVIYNDIKNKYQNCSIQQIKSN